MKNFEMTKEDLAALLDACKPVPLVAIHCGPMVSRQERANAAWAVLGKKMGFDPMTVAPTGKGDRFFSAQEVACSGFEIEPGVFSGCDQSGGDCPECGK